MGSKQTTQQKKPEPEPVRTSGNKQPSNSLDTQNKNNDFQHLGLLYERPAQEQIRLQFPMPIGLRIAAHEHFLNEDWMRDSRQLRSILTGEQRTGGRQPRNSAAAGQEKHYDPQDTTLKFVNGDDDMDFELNDFKSLRAKMSCGHTVTPMSLTIWCKKQLDEGECKFVCGQPNCNAEWPHEEVYKMALLTSEEMKYFDKKIFQNAAKNHLHVKSCPGCRYAVVRADLSNLQVHCPVCTAEKKKAFLFCWQCLKEWKGPAPRSDRCGNDGCQSPVEILRTCPEIKFKNIVGVTGCPSARACPTCGLLTEHDGTNCRDITCPRCKVKFCFVCLKLTKACQMLQSGSYFRPCSTVVAPRQTSIPVWDRK